MALLSGVLLLACPLLLRSISIVGMLAKTVAGGERRIASRLLSVWRTSLSVLEACHVTNSLEQPVV